jgi:hypothetical protein
MNNKLNSYLSILAITCAVAVPLLSANAHELPVQAALSSPASYDLNYQYDAVYEETFMLGTTSIGDRNVIYTRTTDGAYYNYTTTISNDIPSFDIVPEGLSITMTYNRSNTNWFSITEGYLPADTKIGSTNGVGTLSNKVYLNFDNQTNVDYYLYLDLSSQGNVYLNWQVKINDLFYINNHPSNLNIFLLNPFSDLVKFFIPSYSSIEIYTYNASNAYYFDAWYLKDLGVSASYDAGYDVGEGDGYADGLANNPNVLINAVESLIGMFVNFTFILFSLEMFGVSILSIVGVLFGIVAIVWILKTIRG